MTKDQQINSLKRVEESQAVIQKKIEERLAAMVQSRNQRSCSNRRNLRNGGYDSFEAKCRTVTEADNAFR